MRMRLLHLAAIEHIAVPPSPHAAGRLASAFPPNKLHHARGICIWGLHVRGGAGMIGGFGGQAGRVALRYRRQDSGDRARIPSFRALSRFLSRARTKIQCLGEEQEQSRIGIAYRFSGFAARSVYKVFEGEHAMAKTGGWNYNRRQWVMGFQEILGCTKGKKRGGEIILTHPKSYTGKHPSCCDWRWANSRGPSYHHPTAAGTRDDWDELHLGLL
ncbi:hypothetical protein B0H13DRAFT_1904282 [Mycena leptocephala]|nr:hypothetical protein B0H13DRAFT_1904282 [Mycena leptocephala]